MGRVIEAEISNDWVESVIDAAPAVTAQTWSALPKVDNTAIRPAMRVHLIGQMRASSTGTPLVLPRTRKTRAAFAVLALAAPRPVLREHLTSLLWSRRKPEQARASLRQSLHELQTMLANAGTGRVVAERHHLKLESPGLWVDRHAVARATVTRPEALDLLDSTLLTDLVGLDPAFDVWIAGETEQLRASAVHVAEGLLQGQREPGAAVKAARRLLLLAPGHESAWRALMRALSESGDRAAALEAYESCAAVLAELAQTEPDLETRSLLAELHKPSKQLQAAPPDTATPALRNEASRGLWLGVAAFHALDPGDTVLCQGLAEEITTALARFRWINLFAQESISALTTRNSDDDDRWRRLDLDFLLDGSVQRSAQRIRITVRLLDMRAGREVIWSSRFDGSSDDLLALQDKIAAETVAQVDPQLLLRGSQLACARPMHNATAHDLLLRAIPSIYRLEEASYREAGALLSQAAELAPESGAIHGWWAFWHALLIGQGWASDHESAMRRAGELAARAVVLDPCCARAIAIAGYVRGFIQHQSIEETIGLHERALALNPNLPFAWVASGLAHAYAGQHQQAIVRIGRARRLSPFDPHGFLFDSALALPHMLSHDFEAAAALGRSALALNPAMSSTHKGLLAALGHLGRTLEADQVRAHLELIEPGFNIASASERSPLRRSEDRHVYLDGLRLAGLPPG